MEKDLCQMVLELMKDTSKKEVEVLRKYIKNEALTEEEENVSFGIHSINQLIHTLEKMKQKEIKREKDEIQTYLNEKKLPQNFMPTFEEAFREGTKKGAKQTIKSLLEIEEYQQEKQLNNLIENEQKLDKLNHWNHHVICIMSEMRGREKMPKIYQNRNKKLTASEKEEMLTMYLKDVVEDEFLGQLTFMKRSKKEND